MHDVIIVGGGPAGLQAALTLGRMHRTVLLFDSGSYRNARASHMHNFVTHDGTPPATFRSEARAELAAYDVEVRDVAVEQIARSSTGFVVETENGTHHAQRVILATGVRDEMPATPGLEELWGELAFGCPFCHGHELAGRAIGILGGPRALHLVGLLAPIGSSVTLFSEAAELDNQQLASLAGHGVVLRPEPVAGVERTASGGVRVQLDSGAVEVAGLFVGTGRFVQSAPFADQLGLELLESGCIAVDDFGRTSVPDVFAAGDLAHRPTQPMPMASVLAAAAAGQVAGAASVADLLQQ